MKNCDDVTLAEWIALTEATIELLSCSRFMYWLGGGSVDGSPVESGAPDASVLETLNEVSTALKTIGLDQGTLAEFVTNLEAMLSSGKSPDDWNREQTAKLQFDKLTGSRRFQ